MKRKVLDNDIEKNRQLFIDMARGQLCATKTAGKGDYAERLKIALHLVEPELSDQMVPECVYRCGCPYEDGCGWFDKTAANYPNITSTCISTRYKAYNEVFYAGE